MTAPTIRAELALAVRQVNLAYSRLPGPAQDSIAIRTDGVDREIDAAIKADDRPRAEAAIRCWREHWLHQIERAGR